MASILSTMVVMRLLILLLLVGIVRGDEPRSYVPQFEKALKQNIAAFWYPRSVDNRNGGYMVDFSEAGEPKPGGPKMIVSQARMLWLSARLARFGHQPKEMLAAADAGYKFLHDKMWDSKNGGFYWELDATGAKVTRPKKHLYGQAFGLYALSEYALASGRKDVLAFATRVFDLIESKAHDSKYGGYVESFNEDWSPAPASENNYMGVASDLKLMNTHLHLLEALTWYVKASKSPVAHERLVELIKIEGDTVVRKELPACTDQYSRDWKPVLDAERARVSYGHDIENIWLLMDAIEVAGLQPAPFLEWFKRIFAYSRKYGYDARGGGFFESGPFNKPADRKNKVWWVQAEALVSALRMFRLTNDAQYYSMFEETWDFVNKHQIDWEHGEWHGTVSPEGKGSGSKGNMWKAGYHTGRAMIEVLESLRAMR